ncbi:hypothetical protein Tco_1507166 [Tanacetum coccineum]
METKDNLSSCSDLDEQEMQQLQKQANILKENSVNTFNKLKTTTQRLKRQTFTNFPSFQRAFSHLFHTDVRTFKYELSQNMTILQKQLNNEILHENDSKSALSVIKVFKSAWFKRLKHSDASSGEKDCSMIVSDKWNDQGLENQINTSGDESSGSRNECNDKSTSGDDTNIRPSYDTEPMVEVPYTAEYNVFAVDTQHSEQPECIINTCVVEKVDKCDDERVVLANLKLNVDENIKIQKQLKKANKPLAHELKECKSILAETSRTLGESNSNRDSCLIALQNKQTELETYKTLNDRTVDYDKLEHKLNETLGLLAQKEIDIKEGLKLKAYEIFVVKEKHDELVKQSLLTKSHYEGLVKEKTKVITDLKPKEEKDIDKMISMENQLKFLNEIVYKRNQSIQTIHMLAPKGPTFKGRQTFANPIYLKKAQSEKLCLYEILYDKSDPANRLIPDREETLTLKNESQSKLNKDLVRPYDYTKLNSLYEIFKPTSQEYQEQLAHANEHSHDHFRAPTALDMEVLMKTCLMPLALKTQNDSFTFVHELK